MAASGGVSAQCPPHQISRKTWGFLAELLDLGIPHERRGFGCSQSGLAWQHPNMCLSMGWGSWRVSVTGESGVSRAAPWRGRTYRCPPPSPGGDVEHGPAHACHATPWPLLWADGQESGQSWGPPWGSPVSGPVYGKTCRAASGEEGYPPTQCLWGVGGRGEDDRVRFRVPKGPSAWSFPLPHLEMGPGVTPSRGIWRLTKSQAPPPCSLPKSFPLS